MPTFGDRLRHERESRDTPIREVAERTRIGLGYLEALENNDFDALPGPRGFAKLYIRAYAEVLGFDPRPLIDAFEDERRTGSRNDRARKPRARRVKRVRYVPPPLRQADPDRAVSAKAEPAEAGPGANGEPSRVEPEPRAAESAGSRSAEAQPLEGKPAGPPRETNEPVAARAALVVRSRGRRRLVLAPLVAVALLFVAGVALRSSPEPPASGNAAAAPPVVVTQPPSEAPDPAAVESSDTRPRVPAVVSAPAPEPLRVTESGVGSGVVERRLVGRAKRFEQGSTAYFFTRVVGGEPGRTIRHVWLCEDRVIESIELPLGSANWRTYSRKTLRGRGRWVVEARDADGRVLARSEFDCVR